MTNIELGEFLGSGMERKCFANPHNASSCYKISLKTQSKQTIREVNYFKYLQKKNITPSFMPKFLNFFELEDRFILEQERIRTTHSKKVILLREFLATATKSDILALKRKLLDIKREMLDLNVIVSDMRTTNSFVILENKEITRIVFFDGYGPPTLIPLDKYFKFFGNQKINRQWNKFQKKINLEIPSSLKEIWDKDI